MQTQCVIVHSHSLKGKDRTYDITHQQIIKYYKKKQGIPSMLTELYPDMHIEEYESLKNDASFAGNQMFD